MVSLLDVAKLSRTVTVRGAEVEVTGISAHGVAVLLERFPELRKMMGGRSEEVSAVKISEVLPEALASIIAAGCGSPGDKEAEKVAATLTVGEQLEIVETIFKITFPTGVRPFVQKFLNFANEIKGAADEAEDLGREVVTKSPAQSRKL